MILDEVLRPGLDIVFCGTQAGRVSAQRRAYYAGPGNKFWRTLHEIGLTPRRLEPPEFRLLPDFGIGLTDLAKHTSGPDAALKKAHADRQDFWRRIQRMAPGIVAFNGKKAASMALEQPAPHLSYGRQPARGAIGIFILPSTSGAASGFWSEKPWRELASSVRARS